MRTIFLSVPTRYAAQKAAPWAAVIAKCDAGYMAFESTDDYGAWCRQR